MALRERITFEEVVVQRLDGSPEPGFDCGHEEQNSFFYQQAWKDQQELLSVTYLYYLNGLLAGYAALAMDGLSLNFRERGVHIRGRGLGELIVGNVGTQARVFARLLGCRYVILDARPGLERWYERLSFKRNILMQERRIHVAIEKHRDPNRLATSMRLDISRR